MRAVYWCDYPKDAQLPEFWKRRPVVVVSRLNTLHGTVTVLPISTDPQIGNVWAVKLSTRVVDDADCWVVCDKPSTMATSRLSQVNGKVPRMDQADFVKALGLLLDWFPKLPGPAPEPANAPLPKKNP